MSKYTVTLGKDSNVAKGDRFQTIIVKNLLLKKYKGKIKSFREEFKLPDVKIIMDFCIVLKNDEYIFIEAKYRNGTGGKGLCKEEATHSALNAASMTKHFCEIKNINRYSFIIYTNGMPKTGSAANTWIEVHRNVFKTIHDIVVVDNCEEQVENIKSTKDKSFSDLEDLLYG